MSKIGKKAISIPDQVKITISRKEISVVGPKGELKTVLLPNIEVKIEGQELFVSRKNNEKQSKANHGLIRSLLANSVIGVTEGYSKVLKLVGTGYRVSAKGAGVSMTLGFSHPVEFSPLQGVTLKVAGNDQITVEGIDKQLVGQVAADLRDLRRPEPYGGKGIRYEGEQVRRKQGKTAA